MERARVGSVANSKGFRLTCLGRKLDVDPAARTLRSHSRGGEVLLRELGSFSLLAEFPSMVYDFPIVRDKRVECPTASKAGALGCVNGGLRKSAIHERRNDERIETI